VNGSGGAQWTREESSCLRWVDLRRRRVGDRSFAVTSLASEAAEEPDIQRCSLRAHLCRPEDWTRLNVIKPDEGLAREGASDFRRRQLMLDGHARKRKEQDVSVRPETFGEWPRRENVSPRWLSADFRPERVARGEMTLHDADREVHE